MSLANKYRPKDFDSIIGQVHITGILKAKIQSDKGGSSNFLLFGPRGTGKTSSARILAKAINCLGSKGGNPCNQCANCQTINEGKTLDYVEIDAASHTGVDNIREEVIDKAIYPPIMLKKKIYVIDEVHMLSKGAFNALLKTIEEPSNTVAFILATTEIHKVPETIMSRCQVFNFRKVSITEISSHLESICQSEGLEYQKESLNLIAKLSEGCVRDAVKYVDQVSVLGKLDVEHVSKFLGIASEQTIIEFIDNIINKKSDLLFGLIDNLALQGVDLQHFAKQVLAYLDANLNNNITGYLNISEKLGRILAEIRNYPYPALVYKIVLFDGEISGENKTAYKTQQNINNEEIAKQDNDTEIIKQNNNIEAVGQDTYAENTNNKETDNTDKTSEITNPTQRDHNIRNRVIDRVEKPSLQGGLKDKSFLSEIKDGKASITVINMFTKSAIETPENRDYIEKLLSEENGSPVMIDIKFQSKEDYFANMMP